MIPAALQGPLLLAAYMAVLIVATGLPLGLFTPPVCKDRH